MLDKDFASGAVTYLDEWDKNPRIVIPVNFDGETVLAIVDTGAPYCIIAPDVANQLGIDPTSGHQLEGGLSTRGGTINGWLCRIPVTLEAEIGFGVEFETTVFIPEGEWPDDMNFIGLSNFLFRIHFAINPQENRFYFGGPI